MKNLYLRKGLIKLLTLKTLFKKKNKVIKDEKKPDVYFVQYARYGASNVNWGPFYDLQEAIAWCSYNLVVHGINADILFAKHPESDPKHWFI